MPQLDLKTQGIAYLKARDLRRAEDCFRRALAAAQNDFQAWYYLGATLQFSGRLEKAIEAFDRSLAIEPTFAEALNNRGVAHAQQKQFDTAIADLEQASRLRTDWGEPLINLGNLYKERAEYDLAIHCFQRLVAAAPAGCEGHNMLGGALAIRGRLADGKRHFVEALRLEPRFATAHSNLLLALNYDPEIDPVELLAEHRWFDRLHGQGLAPVKPHANLPDPERRLRVGYVSPDFRRHAAAPFLEPILAHHDHERFEVFAYAEVPRPDATSERFRSLVATWRTTSGAADQAVAEQIRADGIDILIDLAGHSSANRLGVFGYRPAPMQVTYLGYPNTTGMAAIGYRLTDAVTDPPGEPVCHTEELIRLPGCFVCYQPPEEAGEPGPLPAIERGAVTFGSVHNLAKLHPAVLALWCDVLERVPRSRMRMVRNTLVGEVVERLRRPFRERGIADDRVEMLRASDVEAGYLGAYSGIDIMLDAFPWSGHATACEALWMGIPLVTLTGSRHAGRMATSVLRTVGLPQLVAASQEDYIAIAARLADDLESLAALRNDLRTRVRNSPLCDPPAFMVGYEAALRSLWRSWCAGKTS
jgi:predicted O-linked N-acetylglucosamine transferase (SPINDLY family)